MNFVNAVFRCTKHRPRVKRMKHILGLQEPKSNTKVLGYEVDDSFELLG